MKKNQPIFTASLFALFVLIFYLFDFLNYSRAGKIVLTGMATIGLLTILSQKYHSCKIVKMLLIFVSLVLFLNLSFHAGLRDIFGVSQDEMMIMKAIFGTDTQESYEFLLQYKPFLLKHLMIFIASFTIFYYIVLRGYRPNHSTVGRMILLPWILFFIFAHLEKSVRKGNPFIYFPNYWLEWKTELDELKKLNSLLTKNINNNGLSGIKYIGDGDSNTVVWVIGESSTRYNWSIYGYNRITTPLMDSIKDELHVFQDIKAAAPITVPAFEMMLTPATIEQPDLWKKYPSVIQIAKKAGYHTYWISNHTTDAHRGITHIFANQADENYMTNMGKARGEGSYDDSVLPAYKKALSDLHKKKFILVHLLGSHPAYNFRYPKEYAKFTAMFDDAVAKELLAKGRAKWAVAFRNFYDNSILYGDYIRYTLLKLLQESKNSKHTAWLYHPDHGEDVAHNTNFSGHNKNVKEQWDIPMVFWSHPKKNTDTQRVYTLDVIDSTILGLLKISTKYYNPKDDLFSK
ncbi:MAG: phosphoethanolamine transferase [Sulfurovum sp.]|nr:phosphoethanolamine transferase [Sulfurovum sp.]